MDSAIRSTDVGTYSRISYHADDKNLPYYEVLEILVVLCHLPDIKCGLEMNVLCSPRGTKVSNDSQTVLQMAARNRLRKICSRLTSCKLA